MTREKLDLDKSFEKLKNPDQETLLKAVVKAESHIKLNNKELDSYSYAFGLLSGAVKAYLFVNSKLGWDDIDNAVNRTVASSDKTQGEGR